MYPEDDLLPLSALQHLLFCERQCALIHLERVWVENRWTAEGRVLHRKAHEAPSETRDGVRITRGLPLHSFELGLVGQADVVTFTPPEPLRESRQSLTQLLAAGTPEELQQWQVVPVEYKRGKPKTNDCDRVQLCAQAVCLEEMLGITVPSGELFYGTKRRRFEVVFDNGLRQTTRTASAQLHLLIASGRTPSAVREKKCETCSLLPDCLPDAAQPSRSARRFFDPAIATHLAAGGPETDADD